MMETPPQTSPTPPRFTGSVRLESVDPRHNRSRFSILAGSHSVGWGGAHPSVGPHQDAGAVVFEPSGRRPGA